MSSIFDRQLRINNWDQQSLLSLSLGFGIFKDDTGLPFSSIILASAAMGIGSLRVVTYYLDSKVFDATNIVNYYENKEPPPKNNLDVILSKFIRYSRIIYNYDYLYPAHTSNFNIYWFCNESFRDIENSINTDLGRKKTFSLVSDLSFIEEDPFYYFYENIDSHRRCNLENMCVLYSHNSFSNILCWNKELYSRFSKDKEIMYLYNSFDKGIIPEYIKDPLMLAVYNLISIDFIVKHYEKLSNKILTFSKDKEKEDYYINSNKNILIVGAGAISNWVALTLLHFSDGLNIDIIDGDYVEITNLNRQVLFYDSIGENKALALARKISELKPSLKARGFPFFYRPSKSNEMEIDIKDYDFIISAVDNFETRREISKKAYKYGIPIIDGGTDPFKGQTFVQLDNPLYEFLPNVNDFSEEQYGRESCVYSPEASIVTVNAIIGMLTVKHLIELIKYGKTSRGYVYNNLELRRVDR